MLLFLHCNTCNVVFRFRFSVEKLGLSRTDITYIRIQVEVSECKYLINFKIDDKFLFCFSCKLVYASWYMIVEESI